VLAEKKIKDNLNRLVGPEESTAEEPGKGLVTGKEPVAGKASAEQHIVVQEESKASVEEHTEVEELDKALVVVRTAAEERTAEEEADKVPVEGREYELAPEREQVVYHLLRHLQVVS